MRLALVLLALLLAPTAAASRIAYVGPQEGSSADVRQKIYAVDADGRHRVVLTRGRWTSVSSPAWSPDGQSLLFLGCRGRTPRCRAGFDSALYVIDANGRNTRRVHPGPVVRASWSADGTKVLALRRRSAPEDTYALLVVDAATGAVTRPTWQPVVEAAWSPRGERIAYMSKSRYGDPDIYVTSADGRTRTPLTRGGINSDMRWSPDARWISFVESGGNPEIMIASADGKHTRQLTDNLLEDRSPVWLTASTLTFERIRGNRVDLLTLSARTGRAHVLAQRVGPGVWSPDRRKVAVEIVRGRRDNDFSPRFVYLMDADGSHLRRITTDGESDSPLWSPDGRFLYYVSGIDGSQLRVADADGRHARWLATVTDGEAVWQP